MFCDKYAAEADGIILFNKVKPHTDFKGYVESGICKMIAIGIAKHYGCHGSTDRALTPSPRGYPLWLRNSSAR